MFCAAASLVCDQDLLRRIIRALRVEHGQERIDACIVARFGEEIGISGDRLLALPGRISSLMVPRRARASETSRKAVWTVL